MPLEDEFKVLLLFVAEQGAELFSFLFILHRIFIVPVHVQEAFVDNLLGLRLHPVAVVPNFRPELYNPGA